MNGVRFNPASQVAFQQNFNFKSEKNRSQNKAFVENVQTWEGKKGGGAVKKTLGAALLLAVAAVVLHKVPSASIPKNAVGNVVRTAKAFVEKLIRTASSKFPQAAKVVDQTIAKAGELADDAVKEGKVLIEKAKGVVTKAPEVPPVA